MTVKLLGILYIVDILIITKKKKGDSIMSKTKPKKQIMEVTDYHINNAKKSLQIKLHIKKPAMSRPDPRWLDAVTERYKCKGNAGSGRTKLYDNDMIRELSLIESRARKEFLEATVPYGDEKGIRLVTCTGKKSLLDKLIQREDEYNVMAKQIEENWGSIQKDNRERLQNLYDPSFYPAKFADECIFEYEVLGAPNPDKMMVGLSEQEVNELLEKSNQAVKEKLQSSLNDAYSRLIDNLETMIRGLNDYKSGKKKSFHDTLITNVLDTAKKLPDLNVTGDKVLDKIAKITSESLPKPAELRKDKTKIDNAVKTTENILEALDIVASK